MSSLEEKIFNAFGTARIFERRVNNYSLRLKILNFVGLFVPLIVGLIFLSIGTISTSVKTLVFILGTIQVVIFLWSIISKWDDQYQYSIMALKRQEELFTDLNALNSNLKNFKILLAELSEKECRYKSEDITQSISDKEKRYGTRKSLYRFQYECQICNKIPQNEKPNKDEICDNCSNF